MILEVGKQFPYTSASGNDVCRASFNEGFFDVYAQIKSPSVSEIKVFKSAPLKYGIFESQNVPFFLFDFFQDGWNFDIPMNILKIQDDKEEAWLNSQANAINLYMIDADTNVLLAMRLIGIQNKIAEELRDILERQSGFYQTPEHTDRAIQSIINSFTTDQMISRTKMLRL